MKAIVPDYRLDMVGEPCPYPAVATLEAMPSLKKGEILEVVSDCPQSINNIPQDARNYGYTVLDIQHDGPTIRYLIQTESLPSRPVTRSRRRPDAIQITSLLPRRLCTAPLPQRRLHHFDTLSPGFSPLHCLCYQSG